MSDCELPEINTPAFTAGLHANYRRLRAEAPVHAHRFNGEPRVSLLRYDDVTSAFRDERFEAIRIPRQILDNLKRSGHRDLENLARVVDPILIIQNPPDHTRLRSLVARAFTPRMIQGLEGQIEALTARLLDEVDPSGFELIEKLAIPLPLIVIADLLGVPVEDRRLLKRWSADLAPILDRVQKAEGVLPAAAAATGFTEYFGRLFEARRREPREDLISALVDVADEGDGSLAEDELLSTCLLLLVAGHETTTHLIGNGVFTLLRHPHALRWLRAHPDRMDDAVEELLRFEPPVTWVVRHVREDVRVRGVEIHENTLVDLVIASANRDPERFGRPDDLDLARADNHHLSFGLGRHFCLGTALARLEGRIALRALLERFPAMKLASDRVEWRPGSVFRGLRALPLSL